MLSSADGEAVGQALLVVAFGVVGAYRVWAGHKKGDGAPPAHRPPPPNEIKEVCAQLSEAVDRLQRRLDRHVEVSGDDMRDLQRQLDRIESAVRLCSAMGEIERRYGRRGTEQE